MNVMADFIFSFSFLDGVDVLIFQVAVHCRCAVSRIQLATEEHRGRCCSDLLPYSHLTFGAAKIVMGGP